MSRIKLTTNIGITYPIDFQNLSYEQAVEQLDLLEQKTGFEDFEADRQSEDVLCLNQTNGDYSLYEIEDNE